MSFNFNNDDDKNPFKDIAKIFHELQKQLMRDLQNAEIDDDNPNVRKFGFSFHMGPDGTPHVTPINNVESKPFQMQNQPEVEEPFTDVFIDDETKNFHIIAEIPGMRKEHVSLDVDGNEFTIQAENSDRKYKKSMLTKYNIDPKTIEYDVRNGVLEINAKGK